MNSHLKGSDFTKGAPQIRKEKIEHFEKVHVKMNLKTFNLAS